MARDWGLRGLGPLTAAAVVAAFFGTPAFANHCLPLWSEGTKETVRYLEQADLAIRRRETTTGCRLFREGLEHERRLYDEIDSPRCIHPENREVEEHRRTARRTLQQLSETYNNKCSDVTGALSLTPGPATTQRFVPSRPVPPMELAASIRTVVASESAFAAGPSAGLAAGTGNTSPKLGDTSTVRVRVAAADSPGVREHVEDLDAGPAATRHGKRFTTEADTRRFFGLGGLHLLGGRAGVYFYEDTLGLSGGTEYFRDGFDTRSTRITRIQGRLFPLAAGNRLTFTEEWSGAFTNHKTGAVRQDGGSDRYVYTVVRAYDGDSVLAAIERGELTFSSRIERFPFKGPAFLIEGRSGDSYHYILYSDTLATSVAASVAGKQRQKESWNLAEVPFGQIDPFRPFELSPEGRARAAAVEAAERDYPAAARARSAQLSEGDRDRAMREFGEGFELLKRNDLRAAAARFRAGLDVDPGNGAAHFYMAEAYQALAAQAATPLKRDAAARLARRHYERAAVLAAGTTEGEKARAALGGN